MEGKRNKFVVIFLVIGIIIISLFGYFYSQNQHRQIPKLGPVDVACTSENGMLEKGGVCCSGYAEITRGDGYRMCTSIKNLPDYRCEQDSDCGLNICDCVALNRKYIEPSKMTCTRVCYGSPKCINNVCDLE